MKRDDVEWLACMIVASIALVYAIFVVPYIPTTDGPQHVLSAHIENHFSDRGSVYPEFYRILPQFAGKGFALLYGPLESVMPWRLALRVALSAIGLSFAWGFAFVVLSLDASRRATSLLGFAIALPYSVYMGFFPFAVGTSLGMFTLAFVLRRPPSTLGRCAVLSLLLLLQGVCHIFTAVLTGAVVLVLAQVDAPRGERARRALKMALIGLPVVLLLGLTMLERTARSMDQSSAEWLFSDRLREVSRWFVPGSEVRAWLVIALLITGIATTLLRARAGRATPNERALAWLALAFLALTLLSPLHMPGWRFFAPRFAALAAGLGLALVRLPERASPRLARACVPLVTAGCLLSGLASRSLHVELADGCADALSGLDAPLHFTGPRLPYVIDPICGTPHHPTAGPVPRASLAFNTPLLYLVDHGGIGTTQMFHGEAPIHAIGFAGTGRPPRPDPRALDMASSPSAERDPVLRSAVLTQLAADGMPFEGIHVVGGRAADFALFERRGYVPEFQHGSLFIARFEGCPAAVLLSTGALGDGPVLVEYGLFSRALLDPEPRSIATQRVDPASPSLEGAIRVPLNGRPCGEIWVRPFGDVDGSGDFTRGDRTCANADAQGRILVKVSREQPFVRCLPSP